MTIRLYKAYTPGTRNRSVLGFEEIIKYNPQKKLTFRQHNKQGRNNRGIITSRYRGEVTNVYIVKLIFNEIKKIYLERL
jgi:large subunit ribosomal protein L2